MQMGSRGSAAGSFRRTASGVDGGPAGEPRVRRLGPVGWEWLRTELTDLAAFDHGVTDELGSSELSGPGHEAIARLLMARVLHSPNDTERAIVASRAVRHLQAATRNHSRSISAMRMLGCALSACGRTAEGLNTLETLARKDSAPRCELVLDLARLQVEASMIAEAKKTQGGLAREEVKREPRWILLKASLLAACGKMKHAHKALTTGRKTFPNSIDLLNEHGIASWHLGRTEEARDSFAAVYALDPYSFAAGWNYVQASMALGDLASARSVFESGPPVLRTQSALRESLYRPRSRAISHPPAGSILLSGLIAEISLADVLNLLWHRRLDGTLLVESERGRGKLYISSGNLIGARSPHTRSVGALDENSYGPLEYRRMLDLGVSKSELKKTVRSQVLDALREMLNWTSGRFFLIRLGDEHATGALAQEVMIETPVALLEACSQLDETRGGRS